MTTTTLHVKWKAAFVAIVSLAITGMNTMAAAIPLGSQVSNDQPSGMFCGRVPGSAHIDVTLHEDHGGNNTAHFFARVYQTAKDKEAHIDCPLATYIYDTASRRLSFAGKCVTRAEGLIGGSFKLLKFSPDGIVIHTKWGDIVLPHGTCAGSNLKSAQPVRNNTTMISGADKCSYHIDDGIDHGTCNLGITANCGGINCKKCSFVKDNYNFWFEGAGGFLGYMVADNVCPKITDSHISSIVQCPVPHPNSVGRWSPHFSSDTAATIKVTSGTQYSTEFTESEQQTWSHSVTASVSLGFTFEAFTGGASVSVTDTTAHTIAHSMTQTLSESYTEEFDYTMRIPGQVWQWQMVIEDSCGSSASYSTDLVTTKNRVEAPCCPPGYFDNPSNPTGACTDPQLSTCS